MPIRAYRANISSTHDNNLSFGEQTSQGGGEVPPVVGPKSHASGETFAETLGAGDPQANSSSYRRDGLLHPPYLGQIREFDLPGFVRALATRSGEKQPLDRSAPVIGGQRAKCGPFPPRPSKLLALSAREAQGGHLPFQCVPCNTEDFCGSLSLSPRSTEGFNDYAAFYFA